MVRKHCSLSCCSDVPRCCRDLAQALELDPKTVVRALGGVHARRRFHVPLARGPYTFPSLGAAIIPHEDAAAAGAALGRQVSSDHK
jgi:hypothetical protein